MFRVRVIIRVSVSKLLGSNYNLSTPTFIVTLN